MDGEHAAPQLADQIVASGPSVTPPVPAGALRQP